MSCFDALAAELVIARATSRRDALLLIAGQDFPLERVSRIMRYIQRTTARVWWTDGR